MSDTPPATVEPEAQRPFSLWRRVAWITGTFFGLLVLAGVVLFFLEQSRADRQAARSMADLDAADPGWRLEEIEAARVDPPPGRNSAVLCKEISRLLGSHWPDPKLDEKFANLPPAHRLDPERMKLLEAEMKRLEPAVRAAEQLAGMPTGRYEITYALNPLNTLLPDVQKTREVAALLRYDMLYRANTGDVTDAVHAGRACVCLGRAMYDEPLLISQLVRIAIIAIGLGGVERSLALGEAKEGELIALQKLLADEEKHPTLLVGVRGERAAMYLLFSRVASGAIPPEDFAGSVGGRPNWLESMTVYPRWQFRRQLPILMRTMNQAVDNARLPPWEQAAAEKKLDLEVREMRSSAPLVAMLTPTISKIAEACRRKTAMVSTMRGLLAVERYRMKHGRWPGRLADVVPEFLDRVPDDPFDGKPLRMVRVADGIVVYSVGIDGTDNGGKIDRERPITPGTDLGYQLWDVAKRRQPAKK